MPAPETKSAPRPKLNREWHLAHRMPKNPSYEQRLEWHAAHAANCACREMPETLRVELVRRELMGTGLP